MQYTRRIAAATDSKVVVTADEAYGFEERKSVIVGGTSDKVVETAS
jgi:hypothetical protein